MRSKDYRFVIECVLVIWALLVWGFVSSNPLHTSTDELGALVGAAKLAGLDWGGVIEYLNYYGFGWYSLFFWVFKISASPVFVYRVIIVITALLRALIVPIAYSLTKKYYGICENKYALALSSLAPLFCYTTLGIVSNEPVIDIIIWAVIYLMIGLTDDNCGKKKKIKYSIWLAITFLFSLTIHTRVIVIIFVSFAVLFCISIINRKEYFSRYVFIAFLIMFFLVQLLITKYQQNIWGNVGAELQNASVEIIVDYSVVDLKVWDVWLHMLIGLFSTEDILSGGVFPLSVVYLLYVICLNKKQNKKIKNHQLIVFAVPLLCAGIVIAGFLVSGWFRGMLSTWGEYDPYGYSYKGLCYVRYFNAFLPPFFYYVITQIIRLQCDNGWRIVTKAFFVHIMAITLFVKSIMPMIKNNFSAGSFFIGISNYKDGMIINENYYLIATGVSVFVFGLFAILCKANKKVASILLLFLFFFFCYENKVTNYDNGIKMRISSLIDSSYLYNKKLESKGMYIDKIYLYDESEAVDQNWKIYAVAQFYFYDRTLYTFLPADLGRNDVIISSTEIAGIEEMYSSEIKCYKLDSNEYWYTYSDFLSEL